MDKIEQALGVLAEAGELMRIGANGDAYEVMADEYTEALATLRAELAGKGWQPIESAPNMFLGYERGDFGPVIYGVIRGPLGDFKLLADPEFEVEPTLWMPMPVLPALDRAREVG